jgi:hypothetical protein
MISSGGEIGNEKVAIVVALGVYLSARCVRQRRGRGLAGLCQTTVLLPFDFATLEIY